MNVAILDTSFIATLLKLQRHFNMFELLPNILEYALVPERVVAEIEAFAPEGARPEHLQRFLDNIGTAETSFFRLCASLDNLILEEIKTLPHVDGGEAEALAQSSKIHINWILIDDKRCLPALKVVFPDTNFHNSLVVLAILAQTELLPDREQAFVSLNKVYNHNAKQKVAALETAEKWLQR